MSGSRCFQYISSYWCWSTTHVHASLLLFRHSMGSQDFRQLIAITVSLRRLPSSCVPLPTVSNLRPGRSTDLTSQPGAPVNEVPDLWQEPATVFKNALIGLWEGAHNDGMFFLLFFFVLRLSSITRSGSNWPGITRLLNSPFLQRKRLKPHPIPPKILLSPNLNHRYVQLPYHPLSLGAEGVLPRE